MVLVVTVIMVVLIARVDWYCTGSNRGYNHGGGTLVNTVDCYSCD